MRYRSFRNLTVSIIIIIIALNFLVFVATILKPELVSLLGLQPANFQHWPWARPWTVITSIFVHADIWHLIANMLTLYFFGTYLMSLIGENRTLLVYCVGGLAGSIVYILLGPPLSIAIGASGAIFALGGALAVMRPRLRVFVFPIPVPLPLWLSVVGGFLILSIFPGIAWEAHLGGILTGAVFGFFLRRKERRPYIV